VGDCELRLAFALRGIERKPSLYADQKLLLTFEIGHAIHRILQGSYGLFGQRVKFTPEVEINSETSELADRYCIVGHCDGIFEDAAARYRLGLEIKSISGKGFSALSGPNEKYMTQATIYMACLDLSHMMFIFVDKNTSLIQPILYPFEQERWDAIAETLERVMVKVMVGGSVPKSPSRMVCRSMCNYYWYCKPGV
jgi:hypothetical protein